MAKGERCSRTEEAAPDLDQYAKDALDQLFNKEEQSYEEFLQGFTFLKKGKGGLMERNSLIDLSFCTNFMRSNFAQNNIKVASPTCRFLSHRR